MKDSNHIFLDSACDAMQRAIAVLARAAASHVPVLIRGESGTGKGVLARWLHQQSSRRRGPFVEVSCPSLSEPLLASELFGHTRGAFTGALRERAGRFEIADRGTLFLDDVGELAPAAQSQLLRFVQDRTFERLGESRARRADVRIVAATNRDLESDVASGRFRLDLFYRLSVVDVRLPALRDRPRDILPLAEHLLAVTARALGRTAPRLSVAARSALAAHSWPGNVRELENEINRAVALASSDLLDVCDLSERVAAPNPSARIPYVGGDFTLAELEREHIERVLERSATFDEAARRLGIDDSTLWRKRRRFSLDRSAA